MSSASLIIRPVEPGDFPAIAELTNGFITGTTVHFGYQPQTPDELLGAWLKTRERYPFVVALMDGRFAGFAKASRWRERDAYGWTAETGIYVERNVHRRGVGRALYGALIDACGKAGFHTLVGGVTLPNEPSVRLHQACGFSHVGTFRQVGWKFGDWHDVAFYQRLLAGRETPAR